MFINQLIHGLLMAADMFWKTGWSLTLGFALSAVLQAVISPEQIRRVFGGGRLRAIVWATAAGAASSSCSYAAAAVMRTLFKKGAALTPALAFLIASTNLVLELGIVLYLLLGWQFVLGEWVGGLVLIAIMTCFIELTCPLRWIEAARQHEERHQDHHHADMTAKGKTWRDRLKDPAVRIHIAQNFVMEWHMLSKDLAFGFIAAGLLAVFVPDHVWQTVFLTNAPGWLQVPVDVVVGPLIAMLTFVCSIGNVPLAAMLWHGHVSFAGVLAFLYADLIIIPLLDVYRRYLGWRMAAYIGVSLFTSMALAALVVDLIFTEIGWIPSHADGLRAQGASFDLDATFWLNLLAGLATLYLFRVARRQGGSCYREGSSCE